jgi:hypothetical protein
LCARGVAAPIEGVDLSGATDIRSGTCTVRFLKFGQA